MQFLTYLQSPVLEVGEEVSKGNKLQGQCKWQCSGDTAHHLDHMAALPRGHLLHHGNLLQEILHFSCFCSSCRWGMGGWKGTRGHCKLQYYYTWYSTYSKKSMCCAPFRSLMATVYGSFPLFVCLAMYSLAGTMATSKDRVPL